jgi:hypothetical protein
MKLFAWILKRGWIPPETVGPIHPGQVWTHVPFTLRWDRRQDRFLVKIERLKEGLVWFSLIPGPTFQHVARPEAEFRKFFRLVPDIIAKAPESP